MIGGEAMKEQVLVEGCFLMDAYEYQKSREIEKTLLNPESAPRYSDRLKQE